MNPDSGFRRLLFNSLAWAFVGSLLVVICYRWVDRPVAFWVHDHGLAQTELYKWLTYPPPLLQAWSPLLLVVLVLWRARGLLAAWRATLFVACPSLVMANQFRVSMGDCFGRYWPETWFGNPSLIGTGTYGFHPLVGRDDLGSFPSGHSARIAGFAAVW